MTKRPDEIVAENIANKFKTIKLLQDDKVADFVRKLSNGTLSTEDWKLMAELTVEKEGGANNGQKN